MKNIQINISFPSASKINKDLDNILKKVSQDAALDLKLDTSAFNKSIGEMSKMLSSLKAQLGTFNILDSVAGDTSSVKKATEAIRDQNEALKQQKDLVKTSTTVQLNKDGTQSLLQQVTKTKDEYNNVVDIVDKYDKKTGALLSTTQTVTNEIEKQKIATEKQEQALSNLVNNLQGKLNISGKNDLVNDSVISDLQKKLNNLTTDSPVQEINELKTAINNLNSSDNGIVRLQNAIVKYGITIEGLKKKYGDIVPKKELEDAVSTVNKLKETMNSLQSGETITKANLSGVLNQGSSSMKSLTTATKNASEQQRLYNKEVVTFGSALKDASTKIGLFSVIYTAMNGIKNSFTGGVKSIVEMDTELSNLAKVVEMTDSQLIKMRDTAVSIGQELGRSATEVAAAQSEFGRLYKDADTINKMTEASILGANTMGDVSTSDVAKGLVTIISALKLESKDAIGIVNSLNEVQNKFTISSSNMLSGLSEVASVAKVSGASLEELQGYMTAIYSATGEQGSAIGNSLSTIFSRIFKVGLAGIDSEGKPEKALNSIGVSVRDLNKEFLDINVIMDDLNGKWGTLSETQKIYIAQQVAGVNHYNSFIALMNNYGTAIEATNTALNSENSAIKENEIYLQSIQGKMESLKATTQGFWFDFINSDMIKGGVDALQSLVNVLSGLQSTFGSVGLTVGTLSTAFLLFTNNPLKSFANDVAKHITTVGGFTDKLNLAKLKISETGTTMSTTQKASMLLGAGFEGLGIKALVAQVKVLALQAALSFGLGLAISAVVGIISSFVGSMGKAEERMDSMNTKTKELSESMQSYKNADLSLKKYDEISKKLDDTLLTEEKRKELEDELLTLKEELYQIDDGVYGIINNHNLTYEKQLELVKQIRDEKLKAQAEDLDKELGNGFFGKDQSKVASESATQIDIDIKKYKALAEAQKAANGGKVNFEGTFIDLDRQNELLKQLEDRISENELVVESYNSSVETLEQTNILTDRSTIDLESSTKDFITTLKKSTEATDSNTKAKEENANVDVGSGNVDTVSIEESSKSYVAATKEITNMQSALEELNGMQEMSGEIAGSLLEKYPEMGTAVFDVASAQQFLNDKIKAQSTIADEAYTNMIAGDENYYNNKILNNENWVSNFRKALIAMGASEEEAYNLDLSKFKNLQELKAYALNTFGNGVSSWLSQYIDISASGYNLDIKNFGSAADAKLAILNALNQEIKKVTDNLAQAGNIASVSTTMGTLFPENSVQGKMANLQLKQAQSNIQAYTDKLNKLNGAIKEVDTKLPDFNANLSGFKASAPISTGGLGGGSSTGGSNSAKDSAASKATEKLVEDLEDLKDRYLQVDSALKLVNNQLDENRKIMDNITGSERLPYLEKEINLLQKQKVALENVKKERQKEMQELKNSLTGSGFSFDSDGTLKNYENRLDNLRGWANSLASDSKENAKVSVENIAKNITAYMKLLTDEIPSVNQELLELSNTVSDVNDEIKSIYKEKLESVADVESQISDLIKKNAEERIETEKKALEKSIENDRKRIESKKKALSEEQKLYNTQYSEDNYESELNEERNKLLQLQSEIDKLQFATDRKSQQRLEELLLSYENQQKLINDKIAEHQNQAINDRFEQEQELMDKELEGKENAYDNAISELDKKLENFLTPQNLTNLVSGAMKSGFVNILGETVNLNNAMQEMFIDTEVGVANLNLQFNDWLDNLNSIKDVMGNISGLMNNADLSTQINLSSARGISQQPVSIDMGGITIEGNVDKDVLADLDAMFKRQQEEIIKIMTKKLSGK